MELHTLGVGGGYTQEDVTSLARIITGWTFADGKDNSARPAASVFNANAHQPGAQRLLGKTYEGQRRRAGRIGAGHIARLSISTAKFHRDQNSCADLRGRRSAAGAGGAVCGTCSANPT